MWCHSCFWDPRLPNSSLLWTPGLAQSPRTQPDPWCASITSTIHRLGNWRGILGEKISSVYRYQHWVCSCSVAWSCPTLCDPVDCSPPGSSVHDIFPGKNTGVSCYFLLQGIFPTPGLKPSLPCLQHWQMDSLALCHLGSPGINIAFL